MSRPAKQPKSVRPKVADSYQQLSKALGVPARTLKAWRSVGAPAPDSSGRYSIEAWEKWAADEGRGKANQQTVSGELSKKEWEIQRIKRQVESMDLDLQQRRGTLVLKSDVTRDIHSSVFAFRTEMETIPGKLAPQVVGLSIPEAELRIRSAIEEALMRLHRDEWARE